MTHPYLLEESPEARQMIERLKEMLQSKDTGNWELAFELLQAGGIPRELYPYLLDDNHKILLCYKYQFFQVLKGAKPAKKSY
jgi:hypothetical protein